MPQCSARCDLPEGDLIRLLMEHHERLIGLLDTVIEASDTTVRRDALDQLCRQLPAHERAEQAVLRPLTTKYVGPGIALGLTHDEELILSRLDELEHDPVDSPAFVAAAQRLRRMLLTHIEAEEIEEFDAVLNRCPADQRAAMGTQVTRLVGSRR